MTPTPPTIELQHDHGQTDSCFQAEVKQILHLVTHSLYSNKEIFLRELISNASDACDKLRFEALNEAQLYEDAPNPEVRVSFDKPARTLTIVDNGIGLSAAEAVANLGTIAKSGTCEFVSALEGAQSWHSMPCDFNVASGRGSPLHVKNSNGRCLQAKRCVVRARVPMPARHGFEFTRRG